MTGIGVVFLVVGVGNAYIAVLKRHHPRWLRWGNAIAAIVMLAYALLLGGRQ